MMRKQREKFKSVRERKNKEKKRERARKREKEIEKNNWKNLTFIWKFWEENQ